MSFAYLVQYIVLNVLSCTSNYRRLIPVTENYDGENFFTMENGKRVATPLLLVLAVVELSDVVFAVDSIPAVSPLCHSHSGQQTLTAVCASWSANKTASGVLELIRICLWVSASRLPSLAHAVEDLYSRFL